MDAENMKYNLKNAFADAFFAAGRKMYGTLLPRQLSNVLPVPPVTDLNSEKERELALAVLRIERVEHRAMYQKIAEWRMQAHAANNRLAPFWDSFFPKTKTDPTVDVLAEQFFNTPQPDYAIAPGETLVVQFAPETADKYLTLLEDRATKITIAEGHRVYRLSDVHLTKDELAELKKAASFTLLVDDYIKARYDARNDVVHFDTGLLAAFARALGGRKVTQDHYVVQPQNGSTQLLLDKIQGYELPVHAIDLRHSVFVFDGRYRLPPALLNSTKDHHVVSPAVCGSGTPVYDIARRVEEARNASQPPQLSSN